MSLVEYNIVLTALLGVVFTMLVGTLIWIGVRIHSKMDEFTKLLAAHIEDDSERLSEINEKLGLIEKGIHVDMSKLDRRLTICETRLEQRGKVAVK